MRNVFVIGPDKKVKLILVYPMTTGRNFDEVLRVIDSLQLTAKHKVSTPVNWKQGDDVIIAGSVSNDEAKEIWPDGWEEPKPYIRIVAAAALNLVRRAGSAGADPAARIPRLRPGGRSLKASAVAAATAARSRAVSSIRRSAIPCRRGHIRACQRVRSDSTATGGRGYGHPYLLVLPAP